MLHSPRPHKRIARPAVARPRARRQQEVILATLDLVVFVAAASEIVSLADGKIAGFVDALRSTIALIAPTGHGDVPLQGTGGRLLSLVIVAGGIWLSLRLAWVCLWRGKVPHPCAGCSLQRHDFDAVHCKACGRILNIPGERR